MKLLLVLLGVLAALEQGIAADEDIDIQISAGGWMTCGYDGLGWKCWGRNTYGSLGLGNRDWQGDDEKLFQTPYLSFGKGQTAVKMELGLFHVCAVTNVDQLKCWGNNFFGQLGLGDTTRRGDLVTVQYLPTLNLNGRKVVELSLGDWHTCAILNTKETLCWGWGIYGQLGLGNDQDEAAEETLNKVDELNFGSRHAVKIWTGYAHTCAVLDNDNFRCWGYNAEGQLGLNDFENRGVKEIVKNVENVDFGGNHKVTDACLGTEHTCVLLDGAEIRCWGGNLDGQLGSGDFRSLSDASIVPPVDFGSDTVVPLSVHCGAYHTCAMLNETESGEVEVRCWGRNEDGQLGQGHNIPMSEPDKIPAIKFGRPNKEVVHFSAGHYHNCVQFDDDSQLCWGRNSGGQLGLGDEFPRGDDEKVSSLKDVSFSFSSEAPTPFSCASLNKNECKGKDLEGVCMYDKDLGCIDFYSEAPTPFACANYNKKKCRGKDLEGVCMWVKKQGCVDYSTESPTPFACSNFSKKKCKGKDLEGVCMFTKKDGCIEFSSEAPTPFSCSNYNKRKCRKSGVKEVCVWSGGECTPRES